MADIYNLQSRGVLSKEHFLLAHCKKSKQSASKQTRPSQAHRLRAAQQQQQRQRQQQQQQKKQQLITNGEHLRVGGCDGGRRPHMPWMPTDPDCKPTCFYMLKRKHKRFLNNSWQHVPQEITTKHTTNEWHFESFLYIPNSEWYNENWCDPPGKLHPNYVQ